MINVNCDPADHGGHDLKMARRGTIHIIRVQVPMSDPADKVSPTAIRISAAERRTRESRVKTSPDAVRIFGEFTLTKSASGRVAAQECASAGEKFLARLIARVSGASSSHRGDGEKTFPPCIAQGVSISCRCRGAQIDSASHMLEASAVSRFTQRT
jgi:hypothetical protein